MRLLSVLLTFFCILSYAMAEEQEESKNKVRLHTPQALEQIAKEAGTRQEFIEVSAESYPGLQLTIQSPLDEVNAYRPLKFKHLFAHPDLKFLHELRLQDAYGLPTPEPSSKLIDVSVPTE